MRNLFDVALKPIAVVTAAVMALRRVLSGLNEIMSMSADNMQAIRVGNMETGVKTLTYEVERARAAYQQLTEEQEFVAASEEKRVKAAEALADAEKKLERAIALRKNALSGGQDAEEINRLYDMADAATKAERKIADLKKQQKAKGVEAQNKSARSREAKDQAKDVEEKHAKVLNEAIAAGKLAAFYYDQDTARKAAAVTYGTITQEDPWLDPSTKSREEAEKARAAAEKLLAQKISLDEEARRLERESLQALADVGNLEKQINAERNIERARRLEERAKIEEKWFANLRKLYRRARELEKQKAEEKSAEEQRTAERIGAISGSGLDVGSMARVGGFLGGERPGLAVADKQLRISMEMLEIAQETRREQQKQTGLFERLTGGPITGTTL
jgi:hypothetical protein